MTLVRCELAKPRAFAAAALVVAIVVGSPAQAASVKDIFEKHGLLGTFAWDCSKPASGDNNWYFVNRVIDADHVQRDFMTGATSRGYFFILDQATETEPGEIRISGQTTGVVAGKTVDHQPGEGIWHIDQNRMQMWESTLSGQKLISGGKLVSNGKDLPWLNRCGG